MHKKNTDFTVADIIDVAGNKVRVEILDTLADEGPQSVNEIMDKINVSQALTSHHLYLLNKTGYISKERKGKQVICSLASTELYKIIQIARTHLLQLK